LTTQNKKQNQMHICIGCHVLSNCSLSNIKFHSTENQLLAWIKKACIFVESDSLGTDWPTTVGFFKISLDLTNLANFWEHLVNQLMFIKIDVDSTIKLALHLQPAQLKAMTNGDDFVLILPNFELYQTRITHGWAPTQVTMDVLGVKGAPKDTKLLVKFFTHLASEHSNDQHCHNYPRDTCHVPPILAPTIQQQNLFFFSNLNSIT